MAWGPGHKPEAVKIRSNRNRGRPLSPRRLPCRLARSLGHLRRSRQGIICGARIANRRPNRCKQRAYRLKIASLVAIGFPPKKNRTKPISLWKTELSQLLVTGPRPMTSSLSWLTRKTTRGGKKPRKPRLESSME